MKLVGLFAIVSCVILSTGAGVDALVSCKDEQGNNVDWFYLYKLPKNYDRTKGGLEVQTGSRYLFITNSSFANWTLSNVKITANNSMPARTLQPLFNASGTIVVAYNDQYPDNTVIYSGGHSKGVVATDNVTGLWLIHSVPKFPNMSTYIYPKTGLIFGQSFLCLSLKRDDMDKVGEQLVFNHVNIFYSRMPEKLIGSFPNISAAIDRKWRKYDPFNNIVNLRTLNGVTFKSFAKDNKYGKDLYEDWLAPELKANLYVETWRNGRGNMASNCSRNTKVFNIMDVKNTAYDIAFPTTQDHSKWAVSEEKPMKIFGIRFGKKKSKWICIGDINRQDSQKYRGGGTVCQKNDHVASLYRQMIDSFQSC